MMVVASWTSIGDGKEAECKCWHRPGSDGKTEPFKAFS